MSSPGGDPVLGMEGDIITPQDLFLFDSAMGIDENGRSLGTLKATGIRPKFYDRLTDNGIHLDPTTFAFERFGR
jgi:pilus assembly protein CpaF